MNTLVGSLYGDAFLFRLEELADEDEYYQSGFKFVSDVWDKPVSDLSKKQADWLERLYEQVQE
jgi:hypothetical protein